MARPTLDKTAFQKPGAGPELAIVAWQALPAIFPEAGKNIGGAETGLWTLARALATQSDIRVALAVTGGHGRFPRQNDGVELWVSVDRFTQTRRFVSEHIDFYPSLRLKRFHPSLLYRVPWLLVTRPLRNRDPKPMMPDPRLLSRSPAVWAGFGVTADTARMVATARDQGKPSILFIQSNSDLDERLVSGQGFVSRWGDPSEDRLFAIRNATTIVCQTRHQLGLLSQYFGRAGELIRNPIDMQEWRLAKRTGNRYVLWIGRYDSFHKRPLLMIQAASQCPTIRFKMVINPGDRDIEDQVRRLKPPNVEIVSCVPFKEMPDLFTEASMFVSTGDPGCEGFPNVLLQAAASHTPIVSVNDFDSFLTTSGAGVDCGGDPDSLASRIESLWENPSIDWQMVDAYLTANHDLALAAVRVAEIVQQLKQPTIC
jgi:glycosyltransferase involved in cell wall biosynthesis